MPIGDRISKYFVDAADLEPPEEHVPVTTAENRVTHLIDGSEYFHALRSEVAALKGPGGSNRFFYFTDWVLWLVDYSGSPDVGGVPSAWKEPKPIETEAFRLDDSSGGPFNPFLDELGELSVNKIDVRALCFVSPFVLTIKAAARAEKRYYNHAATLLSIRALREKPGMAYKACLNLLAHPVGAVHLKMVICGDDTNARAYTSGIDFQPGRVDARAHAHGNLVGGYGWHDVGAKVEGPAADTMYRYFRQLWNEQISRKVEKFRFADYVVPSHHEEAEEVPERTFLAIPNASHHVQVLRTAPQVHTAIGSTPSVPVNCVFRLVAGFARPSLSFAPDGIFEFRAALRKAIAAAEKYIYVEDQAFTGREIMKWINDRLKGTADLKVIFVFGGDPTDPPSFRVLMNIAVNEHLAPGVPSISDRVAFFFRTDGVIVHSKTWIVDDEFVIIGSANAMRRSLYTDCELSVGVLDEDETSNSFAVAYRSDLWAEHCGITDPALRAPFNDLDRAIKIWNAGWSITGAAALPAGTLKSSFFARKRVPFTNGMAADEFPPQTEDGVVLPGVLIPPANDREKIDVEYDVSDGDSRSDF